MFFLSQLVRATLFTVCVCTIAYAEDINLLPKYGSNQKNEAQRAADLSFMQAMDTQYQGDRKKAAQDVAEKGWYFLRQGHIQDAMRRFNQAWLLDNENGVALWGIGSTLVSMGQALEALQYFVEAQYWLDENIDLAVDYANTIAIAGVQTKDKVLIEDAFSRFFDVYQRAPEHVYNLQNWAITLFYIGAYAQAWEKIKLAEAVTHPIELNQSFMKALQEKMRRP